MTTPLNDTAIDRHEYQAGRYLLTALFLLLKSARVYEANNDSYKAQSERFFISLRRYMEGRDNCTIKIVKGRWFVDERFLFIGNDDMIGASAVADRWAELALGGMIVGDTVSSAHIDAFVRLLWEFPAPNEQQREKLSDRLMELGVDSISLLVRPKADDDQRITDESRQRLRAEAREIFFRSITIVKEVVSMVAKEEKISVARTKRVVHSIIDQISEDEAALVELASIKDFDDYTYAHSVNVCIYGVTLGFRLGLGRKELSQLGFAALFHDIGKVRLPSDLINKPARFNEFDWAQMRKHPALGVMTIAKSFRLDPYMARAVLVAFEHHINPDHSGYPSLPEPRTINLYSRIVAIADCFDALSSGRVYIKDPISPDEVLRMLMYQMSAKFDAGLLKMFVGIIGVYPVGSLVLLSDDSLGIVTRTHADDLRRPEVRVIADRSGEKETSLWLDLRDGDNRNLEIVRLIDPAKYNLDISRFVLSDR
ncbi:MAG: HD domain-containing protein [candidate division Zixibacteria bacterium]|nr:HD domain-containing protein [candidate division Zixibacteria bacterium]